MSSEPSQIKHYEVKYSITKSMALEIGDYIRGFCSLDDHVPAGEDGYIVNTLYFDTPSLFLYFETKFRRPARYKIRARYYGEHPTDFVWSEIKYRKSSMIWKTRRKIPVEQWPELFRLQKSEQKGPIFKDRLDSFEDVVTWHGAQPVLFVRYFREPYVTQIEDYGRVTIDWGLAYRMANGSFDLAHDEEDLLFFDDPMTAIHFESPVILEIKVERLVPFWVIDMIRRFGLVQRPFSKYCYGIDNNMKYSPTLRSSVYR